MARLGRDLGPGVQGRPTLDTENGPLVDPVDQAILATRKAVFPLHGLMP